MISPTLGAVLAFLAVTVPVWASGQQESSEVEPLFQAPDRLKPRKATDRYIRCVGQIPPTLDAWPVDIPRDDYVHASDVCSASGGRPRNVGCYCDGPAVHVSCQTDRSDSELSNMRVRDGTLREMCQRLCICTRSSRRNRHQRLDDLDEENRNEEASGSQDPAQVANRLPNWPPLANVPNEGPIVGQHSSGAYAGLPTKMKSCSSDPSLVCSSPRDCASSPYCKCRVQSERYEPAIGVTAFITGCLAASALNGRSGLQPRAIEADACVCNKTFIHPNCCDATDDGLVHGNVTSWGIVALD